MYLTVGILCIVLGAFSVLRPKAVYRLSRRFDAAQDPRVFTAQARIMGIATVIGGICVLLHWYRFR